MLKQMREGGVDTARACKNTRYLTKSPYWRGDAVRRVPARSAQCDKWFTTPTRKGMDSVKLDQVHGSVLVENHLGTEMYLVA
jgi:hypothetical protein